MAERISEAPLVLTIGHSARPLDEYIGLLQAHAATRVIDVRKMPRSRTNPQFNRETLPEALAGVGIGYLHLPGLGGLRRPVPGSANAGWRNRSFQAFADYMQMPEFEENIRQLVELAGRDRPALMCAEAVPWRCHRSLIADALVVRGVAVRHIMSASRADPHTLRAWARVEGEKITYPAG